eukprot:4995920-Prymnesium_polylepis.1
MLQGTLRASLRTQLLVYASAVNECQFKCGGEYFKLNQEAVFSVVNGTLCLIRFVHLLPMVFSFADTSER